MGVNLGKYWTRNWTRSFKQQLRGGQPHEQPSRWILSQLNLPCNNNLRPLRNTMWTSMSWAGSDIAKCQFISTVDSMVVLCYSLYFHDCFKGNCSGNLGNSMYLFFTINFKTRFPNFNRRDNRKNWMTEVGVSCPDFPSWVVVSHVNHMSSSHFKDLRSPDQVTCCDIWCIPRSEHPVVQRDMAG